VAVIRRKLYADVRKEVVKLPVAHIKSALNRPVIVTIRRAGGTGKIRDTVSRGDAIRASACASLSARGDGLDEIFMSTGPNLMGLKRPTS
jgi:hypothetical protein